jgi:hypothetical protein
MPVLLLLLLSFSLVAEQAIGPGIVYEYLPDNRYRRHEIPESFRRDPIPSLDEAARKQLQRRPQAASLVQGLVDRIEDFYHQADMVPDELLAWLQEHTPIRQAFWLAIDPVHDDAANVIDIFDRLRRQRPDALEQYYHLGIAWAVVMDSPDAVFSSRYFLIWAVAEEQWPPMPDQEFEIFDFLVEASKQRKLQADLTRLPWPLLVHVVDLDLPASERAWVWQHLGRQGRNLPKLYQMVDYDDDKWEKHKPRLGRRPYTLDNLLDPQIGGVCVDQAHVCSRVMKQFGIPALKMRGDNRYGGGHAWTAYLDLGGRPTLRDTGRYNFDNYWTGTAFDPQRRVVVTDRELLLMLDGAVQDYNQYVAASSLARMSAGCFESEPGHSLRLAELALRESIYCADVWQLIGRHFIAGNLAQREISRHWKTMLSRLRAHPDLSFAFLGQILQGISADQTRQRQQIYAQVSRLYDGRPDLQLQLAEARSRELFAAGDAAQAVNLAAQALVENCREGALILPLVHQVVDECRQRDERIQQRAWQVLDDMAETQFPKKRFNEWADSYLELRRLIDQLAH